MEFREFNHYTTTITLHPATSIHIPKQLPSEPPEGITYHFSPTGFIGNIHSNSTSLLSTWKNLHNYCHWFLAEFPYLHMMFQSKFYTLYLPTYFKNPQHTYQIDTIHTLQQLYPNHNILYTTPPNNTAIPRNHDTSINLTPIHKTTYNHYHHSRPTPYCLHSMTILRNSLLSPPHNQPNKIYILRKNRLLANEQEIQNFLQQQQFHLISLEDLSLQQQINLFYYAKIIVGMHGAGLTNLGFSKNTTVVEIVHPHEVSPCYLDGIVIPGVKATRTYYHMIAHMKNLPYHCLETTHLSLPLLLLSKVLRDISPYPP